jgi:hypothetical protein
MKTYQLLLLGLVTACSSTVRPVVLSDLDAIAQGASAQESKELVPQAYLQAEKLRQEAEAAANAGKNPLAEVKAERAIAAYGHAQILARIVKAEQRLVATKAQLTQAQTEALALEARRVTVAAELTALDNQVQVEHETEAIADSKPSTPDREISRRVATKSTLTQARLLCVAAELLGADKAAIDSSLSAITELDGKLAKNPSPTPLNEAIKLRSRCQDQLTLVRRPARLAAPNSEATDRLFQDLSEGGYGPVRDDRGIIVTFPAKSAEAKLGDLARIAIAHDQTPLLLVSHRVKGEPSTADEPKTLSKQLSDAGVKSVRSESAGARLPLESSFLPAKALQNERIEIVFVTRL